MMGAKPVDALQNCKDVQFMFARGSGTPYGGSDEWRSLISSLYSRVPQTSMSFGAYEANYPAVEITFTVGLGALVSGGDAFNFGESVKTGGKDMVNFYHTTLASCPNTKFVVMGYSQGARAVAEALPQIDPRNVLYVATFGDPNLYLPEGATGNPPACRGQDLSRYRAYAPNCNTHAGVLGARKPYELSGYEGKVGIWCENDDLICGSSNNLFVNAGHLKYASGRHIDEAVQKAVLIIKKEILGESVTNVVREQATMDTAILIDTTGSMSGYIHKYRAEALRLAQKTFATGGRVALYEYGDLEEFKVKQLCDFSCSLDEFVDKLDNIKVGGGGDTKESALNGLLSVMNTLEWQRGATKSIVLLTDAAYHSPDRDGTTLKQVVDRSLEIDPVNIYVIVDGDIQTKYLELTNLTGGRVFGFDEMDLATEYIVARPVVILPFENYYGELGEEFNFDASESYGVGAEIEHYEWDLAGDGDFEYTTKEAAFSTSFSEAGERFVVVKAVAIDGSSGTMSAKVIVGNNKETQKDLLIKNLNATKISMSEVALKWENSENTSYVLISVNSVLLGYVPVDNGEIIVGDLDFSKDTRFSLVGMDGEFNIGEYIDVLLAAEMDTGTTPVEPSTDGELAIADDASSAGTFSAPNTGEGKATAISSLSLWPLIVVFGLIVVIGLNDERL